MAREGVPLHWLTLQFSSPLEVRFLQDYARRSLAHVRSTLVTGILFYALFGVLDEVSVVDPDLKVLLWVIRYGIICPVLGAILVLTFTPRFLRWMQLFNGLAILIAGLGICALRGVPVPVDNFDGAVIGLILVLIYAYTIARLRYLYATVISVTVSSLYLWVSLQLRGSPPEVEFQSGFYLLSTNLIGIFASYSAEFAARKDFFQTQLLKLEQRRSEGLLLNILPQPIAEQLKRKQGIIAEYFQEVTILFADLVRFTELAAEIPPTELVGLLNLIISPFDELVDRYGLEKIKTIGDAYMAASGIPTPRSDHAVAAAELALAMQDAIQGFQLKDGRPLQLRIGLSSGPVVAGVIGTKKFIYDLWGDTVNLASRMESQGACGQIQVSQATYQRLKDRFWLEERGVIPIKGRGEMRTFWLRGSLSDPAISELQRASRDPASIP